MNLRSSCSDGSFRADQRLEEGKKVGEQNNLTRLEAMLMATDSYLESCCSSKYAVVVCWKSDFSRCDMCQITYGAASIVTAYPREQFRHLRRERPRLLLESC